MKADWFFEPKVIRKCQKQYQLLLDLERNTTSEENNVCKWLRYILKIVLAFAYYIFVPTNKKVAYFVMELRSEAVTPPNPTDPPHLHRSAHKPMLQAPIYDHFLLFPVYFFVFYLISKLTESLFSAPQWAKT
eukprot:GEMP01069393.1.p1 GENE.GEMP01069393.1~~GEMP01069393.1.p1  ORF type:complete len:132 (+),score=4.68 GEMP01069393.1:716-1111(+)